MMVHPKELFIETLREFFSNDSYYHYVRDAWGFPKVPDHTDLLSEAGLEDDETTRIFIGEYYRFDAIYYPALLIKSGGARYTPISMSQNRDSVVYTNTRFIDGYGNETIISTPDHFKQNGAWEGTVTIDVLTLDPHARDDLVGLISILFMNLRRQELQNAGVHIKGINAGSQTESEDGNNKLFKQTVTADIRTEWRRKIPVSSTIDAINICVDFGNLETTPVTTAPNIRIATQIELLEAISEM